MDTTPEETDKDDEDGVSHLDTHNSSESRQCCVCIQCVHHMHSGDIHPELFLISQHSVFIRRKIKRSTNTVIYGFKETLNHTDLVERSQEPRLLAGEAVAFLDGGDGALHVARHQQLRQLQQTVTQHEELQRGRRPRGQAKLRACC